MNPFSELEQILINSYSFANSSSINSGYLLMKRENLEIIFANKYCLEIFSLEKEKLPVNSLDVFRRINELAVSLMNERIYNRQKMTEKNNKQIEIIHEILLENIPVRFIFYVLHQEKFHSLLANFIPVSDKNGKVIFIQAFFSQYDFWGWTNMSNLFDGDAAPKREYMYLGDDSKLPIKLSQRQLEIVFLLTFGASIRQIAEVLKISYGTLSSTLRNSIYPKFNMHTNEINELIQKAISYGYNRVIPQSLCRPELIILDSRLREQYFDNVC